MKTLHYILIVLCTLLVVSCSKVVDPVKEIGLGSKVIKYQEEETSGSLVLPPDLTEPDFKGDFNKVTSKDETEISKKINNVEVLRDNYRRWLLVDLPPEEVWDISKDLTMSGNLGVSPYRDVGNGRPNLEVDV